MAYYLPVAPDVDLEWGNCLVYRSWDNAEGLLHMVNCNKKVRAQLLSEMPVVKQTTVKRLSTKIVFDQGMYYKKIAVASVTVWRSMIVSLCTEIYPLALSRVASIRKKKLFKK